MCNFISWKENPETKDIAFLDDDDMASHGQNMKKPLPTHG